MNFNHVQKYFVLYSENLVNGQPQSLRIEWCVL